MLMLMSMRKKIELFLGVISIYFHSEAKYVSEKEREGEREKENQSLSDGEEKQNAKESMMLSLMTSPSMMAYSLIKSRVSPSISFLR